MQKASFSILLFICSLSGFSQYWPPLFSVTGDTVCYSSTFGQTNPTDSSVIWHTIYILHSNKNNTATLISNYEMPCSVSNACLQELNKDTLAKYHLQYNGEAPSNMFNKDFVITAKPTNTHVVDKAAFGTKYIYQTTITVNISCKGIQLYNKTFDAMFKGNTPADFQQGDFVSFSAWCKKNTRTYFFSFSIKEFQTFTKPTDTPDYHYTSFEFIIP